MQDDNEYRRGRSVVSALHVHLVFVTKRRRDVLDATAIGIIRSTAAKVCRDFGATLAELDGEDDHVHLLIEYPPTVQISRLVNSLKGVTSRVLRSSGLTSTRDALWSPSYFAASCGGAPLEVIRRYVENQRR